MNADLFIYLLIYLLEALPSLCSALQPFPVKKEFSVKGRYYPKSSEVFFILNIGRNKKIFFFHRMLDRDVGVYEAVAVNEHGTARQRVQLKIAEYPEFLKRPSESWVPLRKTCRLEARVIGVPYPEIKWYKDWKPLAQSSRIQVSFSAVYGKV